jgi:hypothetical protein
MYYSNFNADINPLKESLILEELQKELIKEAQWEWLKQLGRRVSGGFARYFRGAEPAIRTSAEEAARQRELYEHFIRGLPGAEATRKGRIGRAFEKAKGLLSRKQKVPKAPATKGPGELYWREVAPEIQPRPAERIEEAFETALARETAAQPTATEVAQTVTQTAPAVETTQGRRWIGPAIVGGGLAAGGLLGYGLSRRRREEE